MVRTLLSRLSLGHLRTLIILLAATQVGGWLEPVAYIAEVLRAARKDCIVCRWDPMSTIYM